MSEAEKNKNNPLHGIKLKNIIEELVEFYGWERLAEYVDIGCFMYDPSINSSLKLLRKTPWARNRVEILYIEMKKEQKAIS